MEESCLHIICIGICIAVTTFLFIISVAKIVFGIIGIEELFDIIVIFGFDGW